MRQQYLTTKNEPSIKERYDARIKAFKEATQAMQERHQRDRFAHEPDTQIDRAATASVIGYQYNYDIKKIRQRLINQERKPKYRKACRLINQAFKDKKISATRRKQLFAALNYCYEQTNGDPLKFISVRLNPKYEPFPTRSSSTTAIESKQTTEEAPRAQSEPQPNTAAASAAPAPQPEPDTLNAEQKKQREKQVRALTDFRYRERQRIQLGRQFCETLKSPLALLAESGAESFDTQKFNQFAESQFKPISPQ
ncbi:MAG: hypothetical protein P1U34_08270 [Coxiellaceae bacterium]|nr:hypothetical protein [Coxiellaceae bacterium]